MTDLGLQIVPAMSASELVETVVAAEELGYSWCQVADEGLMPDPFVALATAAQRTSRIRLGPATNGYTRHPGATAAALATLDRVSGGRAFVTLVAGGTMVLNPLGIPRDRPGTVLIETMEILRRLWTGETVSWEGRCFRLAGATLTVLPETPIPILVATRGERLLAAAGSMADGVILIAKADLEDAFGIVNASLSDRPFLRVYLDRLVYNESMLAEAKALYSYVALDSPDRMLTNLGLSTSEIDSIRAAVTEGGAVGAAELITPEMIGSYQIAGTPRECSRAVGELVEQYQLDMFMLNVISGGFESNLRLLEDVAEIVGST